MLKLLNLTMPSIGAAFVSIAAIAPSYAALLQFNTDAGSFRLDTRTGEVFSNFDPDNDFFKLLSFSGGASFQSGSGTINVNSETCSGGIDIIDSQTGEPQYLCYASGYERIQLFLQFQGANLTPQLSSDPALYEASFVRGAFTGDIPFSPVVGSFQVYSIFDTNYLFPITTLQVQTITVTENKTTSVMLAFALASAPLLLKSQRHRGKHK
ncbi:hypothetical protein Ava_B0349 (plasmid) [Trichormus variabilis ATCC 29413]|uniref:Uncharacterized protein n=2 Tax=Anabaena variabilis TaxID=264691 RepID=Q3M1S9_TRIV2|nr:hypothetical protein Ava_B0349 [Trichormus variabilis ATCC 29413]